MLYKKSRILFNLIFFFSCYFYIWLVVKPHLIYYGFGTIVPDVPVFSTGWRFLRESFGLPGGLVFYAYGFLSQWYYYSPLGALLIVLVALCLCELSRRHYIYAGRPDSTILHYFPAVIVFIMYNYYEHPLAACLTLFIGLLLSIILERIPLGSFPIRMLIFCVMVTIGYSLAGAGGVLVFSLMTVVYLLFLRRDWLQAALTLPAAAIIIWILSEYVFHISPEHGFLLLTPFSQDLTLKMKILFKVLVVMLYFFAPLSISVSCLWAMLFDRETHTRKARPVKAKKKKTHSVGRFLGASPAYFKKLVVPFLPLIVIAVGLYFTHDKIHRQIVQMNYLSRRRRWSEVLELGNRLPKNIYNIYCNHEINRALYHTGRLGYDMLCFPQNPHSFLLTHDKEESAMTQLKMCDIFIEIGNINFAEKLACEFHVEKGNAGVILEKLAWINIIKGNEDTARIYLNALKKDLIYRDRADTMLSGLTNGFEPDQAAYISRINSCIRKNGNPRLYKESIEEMFTGLLGHNPGNNMAFEYLMAFYLLAGQLDKIAENIEHLDRLGYRDIPTLYEEAMLIYLGQRKMRLDLSKLNIKRRTIGRYKRFVQLCNSMQEQNRPVILQQLMREFGTSYFFYYYKLTTSRRSGT